MRLRTLLLLLVSLTVGSLLPLPGLQAVAHAATTPAEAAALAAASQDHTAYTLPPATLAKAEALATTRHVLYFGGALWGILSLYLLLQLRIAARMRNVAVNVTRNRWGQGYLFFFEFLLVTTLLSLPLDLYDQQYSL